jgi:hypothetical protein
MGSGQLLIRTFSSKFRHTQGQSPAACYPSVQPGYGTAKQQVNTCCREDTNCDDHEPATRSRPDKQPPVRQKPENKTHGSHRPFGSHISTMRNSQQTSPSDLGPRAITEL